MADWFESPTAVLPYSFDWTEWLAPGETLASSQFLIAGPDTNLPTIISGSETIATPFTRFWMTGGTLGKVYSITNRVAGSLDPSDIDDRTSTLLLKIGTELRFKDPDATVPFVMPWPRWLDDGETIVSSAWSLTGPDAALSILPGSPGTNGRTTSMWLTGGTVGRTYRLTNHIITSSAPIARRDDRAFDVLIKQR